MAEKKDLEQRAVGNLSPMGIVSKGWEEEEEDQKLTPLRTAETLFRLLPVGLCVTSLVIMLKNSQTNDYGSVSYSDLGSFKYLVHANGICAGYALLTAVVAAVPRHASSSMSRAWTFFFLDQLLTYVILAAGSVSTEVAYLAYHGDSDVTWSEACSSFGSFCRKATGAISITFLVAVCFAGLSLISSYRLFSKYDAPAVTAAGNGNGNGNGNSNSNA